MPLEAARSQIEAAAELEPELLPPNLPIEKIVVRPLLDPGAIEFRLWERLSEPFGAAPVRHVITTPWLKLGGADLVVVNIAASLLRIRPDDNILICCTHAPILDALGWLPKSERLKVVCIDDAVDASGEVQSTFSRWLARARCEFFYVVNSALGWNLTIARGATLREMLSPLGLAFAYAYDKRGRRGGYAWGPLRKAWPYLDGFAADNGVSLEMFARDHFLNAEERGRLYRLSQPVDPALKNRLSAGHVPLGRPRVLWAGRFGPEKGLDVALEIATATPDAEFAFHGGSREELEAFGTPLPDNVVAAGPYARFADLPLETFSLLLHSSHSDGMPNVLLEAGRAGLPIVATAVGGVGELVDADTGWLIPHGAGVAAYRRAIADILARPDLVEARREAMRRRIEEHHTHQAFDATLDIMLRDAARARAARNEGAA